MYFNALVEYEISKVTWGHLKDCSGAASCVPAMIRDLLGSDSIEQARAACRSLESRVAPQGNLFEVAPYVITVLGTALSTIEMKSHVRLFTLDLIFLLVAGESHYSEVARGIPNLGDQCRIAAKPIIGVMYKELISGDSVLALNILEHIDTDIKKIDVARSVPCANFADRTGNIVTVSKAREIVMEEGNVVMYRDGIAETLRQRFGSASNTAITKVNQLHDRGVLKELYTVSIRCKSLDDFGSEMREILTNSSE